jgi:hypothetical protein
LSKQLAIVFTLLMFLLAFTLTCTLTPAAQAQGQDIYVSQPVFPVRINASQIPIGSNWTLVYSLQANVTYHAYFYGKWINNGSEPKTDYDVYVYNPLGELESVHTEAAGLPEHLGDNVSYPFFTPKYSGNYSFVIRNDPRESQNSEGATFMLIPHVETDEWYSQFIQGKVNDQPVQNTSWAVEFVTASRNISVKIQVPDTLDMYEARLYLMANPSQSKGTRLNNVSLAWEPGLYGNRTGNFGGYNLDSKQYRGLAYASCEYLGQDMLINYTSQYSGESLYHLVFIGEKGEGNIDYAVQTDFEGPSIEIVNMPQRVFPEQQVNMTFNVKGRTELEQVSVQYTADGWNTREYVSLISNQTRIYTSTIPEQAAGTKVSYNITAIDVLNNTAEYTNDYVVKYVTVTNCTVKTETWGLGRNVTISGSVTPTTGNLSVLVTFTPNNGSIVEKHVLTLTNGTFFASFSPNATGRWTVQAACLEDGSHFGSVSESIEALVVEESDFLGGYSMYIYAAASVMAIIVIAVVVIRKRRE